MGWLHTLWFGYFWPSCQGNGPEAILEIAILAALGRLFWPLIKRELHKGDELLHQKLDHIIRHHPGIPAFDAHSVNASPLIPAAPTKGKPVSFDLSTIETRFHSAEEDIEEALHSKVADAILTAAKTILPLVPEGADVEALLSKFDEVATEAHKAVDAVAPVVEADTETVANDAATAESEVEPAAPVAPETPAAPAATEPPASSQAGL